MENFFYSLAAGLIGGGVGVGLLIRFLLKSYVGTFLGEKAKNVATKQDIGEITKIIEGIKHKNSLILEEVRGKHQLRLGAIEKRLEAYQVIYEIGANIVINIDVEKGIEYQESLVKLDDIKKLRELYIRYNIYLSTQVIQLIAKIMVLMNDYMQTNIAEEKNKLCDEIFDLFTKTHTLIRKEVKLPPIGDDISIIDKIAQTKGIISNADKK